MRKLGGILAALILACVPVLFIAQPAQAVPQPAQAQAVYGSIKVCNSGLSITDIIVKRGTITSSDYYYAYRSPGYCTGWLSAAGVRVDTDPDGPSHSFKVMITTAPTWASRPCHENSDDHNYDPPNPTSGDSYDVWIRNYDHGDCTN